MPKPYTPNDAWSQKAAKEGYRARSVYKLMELDKRFRLLKRGQSVLDLGAAPGSWLQYISGKCIVDSGKRENVIIGIDLQEIEPIQGVQTYQTDITDIEAIRELLTLHYPLSTIHFDVILSDLAPSTSGIKDVDQWKSIELSQAVIAIANELLKPTGRCVIKVLQGADFDSFLRETKREWDVKITHTEASRDRSREVYLILQKKK